MRIQNLSIFTSNYEKGEFVNLVFEFCNYITGYERDFEKIRDILTKNDIESIKKDETTSGVYVVTKKVDHQKETPSISDQELGAIAADIAMGFFKEAMSFQRGILEVFSTYYSSSVVDGICEIPQFSLMVHYALKSTIIDCQVKEFMRENSFTNSMKDHYSKMLHILFDVEYMSVWLEKYYNQFVVRKLYANPSILIHKSVILNAFSKRESVPLVNEGYRYFITLQTDFSPFFYNLLNSINARDPYQMAMIGLLTYGELFDTKDGIGNNDHISNHKEFLKFSNEIDEMKNTLRLYRMGVEKGRSFILDNFFIRNSVMEDMFISNVTRPMDETIMQIYIKQLIPIIDFRPHYVTLSEYHKYCTIAFS